MDEQPWERIVLVEPIDCPNCGPITELERWHDLPNFPAKDNHPRGNFCVKCGEKIEL